MKFLIKKDELKDESKRLLEKLQGLDPNSEEYTKVLGELKTLSEVVNEKQKVSNEKKFGWMKVMTDVGAILIPVSVYGFFIMAGFKFEENGSITSYCLKDVFKNFTKFLKR